MFDFFSGSESDDLENKLQIIPWVWCTKAKGRFSKFIIKQQILYITQLAGQVWEGPVVQFSIDVILGGESLTRALWMKKYKCLSHHCARAGASCIHHVVNASQYSLIRRADQRAS